MLRKDIENMYTDIVKEYVDKGYRIYYPTMGGSQGEIAKIDLTNDKNVIRILIDKKIEFYNHMLLEYLVIIVGENTDKLWGNSFSDIIWNDNLKIISEVRFYKIGKNDNLFFGTKQEAIDALNKKLKRFDYENYNSVKEIIFSDKAKEIVLPFMKRQRKCKSITVKQIEEVKKVIYYNKNNIKVHYYVKAKGDIFRIK